MLIGEYSAAGENRMTRPREGRGRGVREAHVHTDTEVGGGEGQKKGRGGRDAYVCMLLVDSYTLCQGAIN